MGIFRIYSSKSNTIASASTYELLNSSQNPVTDLWYGGTGSRNSISRFMIYFDLNYLESKLNSKEINSDYITAYKLKIKNCIPSNRILEPEYEFDVLDKKVSASFDLIAFPINKFWDEGRGFSLEEQHEIVKSRGNPILSGYSNWLSATSSINWDEPGIFTNPSASTAVTYYSTQHFSIGSEDLEMDITNIVNDWLSGGSENNGIAVAYSRPFETMSGNNRYISSFYTNKTNTAYKPYIEVQYNQAIKDNRYNIANNRRSKLFLYLFSGNTAVNYLSADTVSIKTNTGSDVYTGLTPIHHSKGVYYVDVLMTGTTRGERFKDVWHGITFEAGLDQQDYTQKFTTIGDYFSYRNKEINEFAVNLYGIENNDVLQTGETIRVYAEVRINYSLETPKTDFGLEYKITMNQVDEVIPWTPFNSAIIDNCLKSYFDIDTLIFINNQNYEVTVRINELGTKRVLPEKINFKVVNNFTETNF